MAKTLRAMLNDADTILLDVAERLEELAENAAAYGNTDRAAEYDNLANDVFDQRSDLLRIIDRIPAGVR